MQDIFILLAATALRLKAGLIFGIIWSMISGIASIIMFREVLRQETRKEKWDKLQDAAGYVVLCAIGLYTSFLEYNRLTNYQYVDGTTIGYCRSGDSGQRTAIEFEYTFKEQKYKSCNTCSRDGEIKVPGGKFKVRVSEFDPSLGLMDFDEPIN